MKTIPFSKTLVLLLLLLSVKLATFSQNASLVFFKNGLRINPIDMSVSRGDKLTVQIANKDAQIKYRITDLNMEVRTHQHQQIKKIYQAKKFHKNLTLNTDFETSPKIEINIRDYASKHVSRILLKFLLVEQLIEGEPRKVDWITYGKEYEFYYYN